uniref:SLC26A/SulP transporter domain-containing protein n=1 Tax=Glossina brevipalpis TaxID=37001 RepID=A0A1A9WJC3_9MUSC
MVFKRSLKLTKIKVNNIFKVSDKSEENNENLEYVETFRKNDEGLPMKSAQYFEDTEQVAVKLKYEKPKEPNWIFRRIYILTWIRHYDREKAISDLIAGITLGLTIIPQSIAYAALAGRTSEYGLYTAFIGSIMYVFFGTIPQVSIGPTSLMSLMVLQYCYEKPIEIVIVLAFLAGCVELLMGIFQLGFIVSFIPSAVTKGFTTGTSIIVALCQVKNLLGVKLKGIPAPKAFFENIQLADAVVGITCFMILLSLRQLSSVTFKNDTLTTRRLKKLLWYISISRNALVVFTCGLIAYLWIQRSSLEAIPITLSSKVDSGIPTIKLPPFAFVHNNRTYVFTDICRELGSGIIVVPIVAVLANVAIAKAFVKDGILDASQEMLTLGICNVAGSFFSAMPTCGAFTRSAVSQASGVRTPMAGIYTGVIVLSALSILTPYFQYIPKSSLSAVLIAAVIFMVGLYAQSHKRKNIFITVNSKQVDLKPLTELWKTNKKDFISWLGCLIVCLAAGVEMGLLYGIILNMIFVLLRLGKPKLEVSLKKSNNLIYVHIKPMSDIYYTGVEMIRSEIRSACFLYRNDFPIVLDCSRFMLFDATFLEMLNAVAKDLCKNNVLLILQFYPDKHKKFLNENINIRFTNDCVVSELIVKA